MASKKPWESPRRIMWSALIDFIFAVAQLLLFWLTHKTLHLIMALVLFLALIVAIILSVRKYRQSKVKPLIRADNDVVSDE